MMKGLLGVLTVAKGEGIGGNRRNFYEITQMGRRLGFAVVVLTPESLLDDRPFLQGWVWERGWKKTVTRWPDVIYNRIPDRRAERREEVRAAKKRLSLRGIPYYNPGFFNKKKLAHLLSRQANLAAHLPQTVFLRQAQDVFPLLQTMGCVYLKPVDGKAGEGIIRVEREGGGYRMISQRHGRREVQEFTQEESLLQHLLKPLGKREYVGQQGIALARVDDCPFDLRCLVQRGRDGSFALTGIGCRVAAEDGITTHVPQGGHIRSARSTLKLVFPGKEEQLLSEVQSLALRCAEGIAAGEKGIVGEMSLDIGIDREGKLWIFEANAKPMKFDEPDIRERSLRQLFAFCQYLKEKANGSC